MNENMAPTAETIAASRQAIAAAGDVFDAPAKVWLVEDVFNPRDSGTYPAHSAAFASTTAGAGGWLVQFDAMTSKWFLVAKEPSGGWDFVAIADGISIAGYIVELASDTDVKIGGNVFENPVPIVSTGQHVTLPYVSLPIEDLFPGIPVPQTES